MNLYLLTWKWIQGCPIYDTNREVVVRAKNASHARQLAADKAGDEGREAWLSPKRSTCRQIKVEGPAEVVIIQTVDG